MNKIKPIFMIVILILICLCAVTYYYNKKDENLNKENNILENTEKSEIIPSEELYSQIETLNAVCKEFFEEFGDERKFLSQYSFLYDDFNKNEVTVEIFENEGSWVCPEELKKAIILFIKPSDLIKYNENIEVEKDDDLCVFSAVNTKEGVIVSSYKYKGGIISNDDFRNLMLEYSPMHGEIINPKKNNEQYKEILEAVSIYTESENYTDVKHIACDEKYAAIVVGNKKDSKEIKEYILINEQEQWKVVMDNIEKQPNDRMTVNYRYPNLDLGILPIYNISSFGEIKNEFNSILEAMVSQNIIKESDLPPLYSCGVGSFVFFEFSSSNYLGVLNEKGELSFYEVKTYEEAIKYMLKFDKNPPVFILNIDM